LNCTGCKWLIYGNVEYEQNIIKLIKIQKWVKKMIIRKGLMGLIPQLMPLYYHPCAKGGYFHKKNMFSFISNIKK
jgi:hypothetical protein